MQRIKVGSRKSKLALTQTNWVINQLKEQNDDLMFDLKHIVTKGDRILDVTLSKVGGKGLFVKEIEQALFDKEIDFAVHSMKDMPSILPDGLTIACVPVREDFRDAFISKGHVAFKDLPEGAVVGTSSLRRSAQLLSDRPDLTIRSIRGNIDTRLRKLQEEDFDAIILAAAGLKRMGWSDDIVTEYLSVETSLPAVGQGALAIECRADDGVIHRLLSALHDEETYVTVQAERAFLKTLEGGCQVPIAAFCRKIDGDLLELTGLVGTPDGKTILKETLSGREPVELGTELASRLMSRGAKDILDLIKEDLDQS
ncbi:hydroxymethylbilane synthase [Scopulibacillus darangshiensis]|uniref:Porphobilinogen deaminase n=1 Tax=Scopulibacillus darangshiensis TaxID=442528 RepID=A0A4R2PB37_9BACL|nr:hydroxymethylbilane synthase [Scopulibacillus darangshiensis]TCP32222.1 hydroxymethylbilane synthase [Scopulibacillus darangshiensis]